MNTTQQIAARTAYRKSHGAVSNPGDNRMRSKERRAAKRLALRTAP